MDTIFAPATARGKAGLAVVRISGPGAFAALQVLGGGHPEPRRMVLRRLRDASGLLLDEALVVRFEAGSSFTGEPAVELHLHGSHATVAAVLAALAEMPRLRLAQPGEFARRALENGCLDLSQVEGLADLIDAETEAQRRQALAVLSGALGKRADSWRERLVRAAALIEATIDFADEDVPSDVTPEVRAIVDEVRDDLLHELAGAAMAERIRDGFEVAIVGLPNVGKSTLLNALAGREAALTSEVAGTTRDVIEVRMDLAGLPVTLLDTAGLRDTADPVERMGVDLARRRALAADLRLFLVDARGLPEGFEPSGDDIVVAGKADLTGDPGAISPLTGQGLDALIGRIGELLSARASRASTVIRARHQAAIRRAVGRLDAAALALAQGRPATELVAEDLRGALAAIEALVGRVDVEHLLDEIFSRFCIGK
jgi:tRNA modification GTPase